MRCAVWLFMAIPFQRNHGQVFFREFMSDNKEKYTPQELARLTGEAMIAWSKDPSVTLQALLEGVWTDCPTPSCSNDAFTVNECRWSRPRRIKPAKRTAPLDQSDFIGPNRVTHVRQGEQSMCAVLSVCSHCIWCVWFGGGFTLSFQDMKGYQISRDNGLTWGPAEKEVEA